VGLVFGLGIAVPGTPSATAAPGLFVGVTENAFRWRSVEAVSVARDLGLSSLRVTLAWRPSQTALDPADVVEFDALVPAASGLRIVVTVVGPARGAPTDDAQREAFCTYVRELLVRYPSINDVVVWNEPNLGFFWQPQFDIDRTSVAPGAYVALLARCWDVLHAVRPGVNLVTTTSPRGTDDPAAAVNPSHAPATFVRKMGAAYRASGRQQPIFDTIGHNPYGTSSAELPWQKHLAPSHIAQGDVDRLVDAYAVGFGGTGQPVPGRCSASCPTIWYLEAGYQSVPDRARRSLYVGRETDARPVADTSAGNQSSQLIDGIRLAYCQPYVGAFFNFLLWDERELARWQSGVLWVDGDRKPAYQALRTVAAEVRAGSTDCAALRARMAALTPTQPSGDALVERIEWSTTREFSSYNELWWFGIGVRANSTFRAGIFRVDRRGTRAGTPTLSSTGGLRRGRPRVVRFEPDTLQPGLYRMDVVVTRRSRPLLRVIRRSPTFVVR
jgi:hypothetical protein